MIKHKIFIFFISFFFVKSISSSDQVHSSYLKQIRVAFNDLKDRLSESDLTGTKVSLILSKDEKNPSPILIFDPLVGNSSAYHLELVSNCSNSMICRTLSRYLPSYFAEETVRVTKLSNIEKIYEIKETSIKKSWYVSNFYGQRAVKKIEHDTTSRFGFKRDVSSMQSWYSLRHWTEDDAEKLRIQLRIIPFGNYLFGYCNFGTFAGYTNDAIYMVSILSMYCNVTSVEDSFLSFKGDPYSRLYQIVRS